MSNLEHYFENLLFDGRDIPGDWNKNALSEEQQSAVEECADYVIWSLFDSRERFLRIIHLYSDGALDELVDEHHTCETCGKICQMMGTDRPACLSYEPLTN